MKLFLLSRVDYVNYDEYDGKVIRAIDAESARRLANDQTGDEGKIWNDPERVMCEEITTEGDEAIILDSFCAG